MIRLIKPSATGGNYSEWKIFIGFTYAATDPGLNNKLYMTRNTRFDTTLTNSGNAPSPQFVLNVTNAASRINFLDNIALYLITIQSIIGIHTVVNKTILFYGNDPGNPSNLLFKAVIDGTCNIPIPNNTFFIQEYTLSPSFEYIIPLNNNCCSLIYTDI